MLVRFLKSSTPDIFINTQHIKSISCYYGYGIVESKLKGQRDFCSEYWGGKVIPDYFIRGNIYNRDSSFYFVDEEGKRITPEEFMGKERPEKYKRDSRRYDRNTDYKTFLEAGYALQWEGIKIILEFTSMYSGASIEGTGGGESDTMNIYFSSIEDGIEAVESLKRIIGYEGI